MLLNINSANLKFYLNQLNKPNSQKFNLTTFANSPYRFKEGFNLRTFRSFINEGFLGTFSSQIKDFKEYLAPCKQGEKHISLKNEKIHNFNKLTTISVSTLNTLLYLHG